MCRLFAWSAPEPVSAEAAFGADRANWIELSHVHADGWGGAWRTESGIALRRDERAAHASGLHEETASLEADAAILHLRWTTGSQVCVANTHPWVKEGIAFCHNGALPITEELKAAIDSDLRASLEGDTDSELYFALLLTHLRRDGDMATAIRRTLAWLEPSSYSSLNAMVLTDSEVWIVSQHRADRRPDTADADYYELRWHTDAEGITTAWSSGIRARGIGTVLPSGSLLRIPRSGAAEVLA